MLSCRDAIYSRTFQLGARKARATCVRDRNCAEESSQLRGSEREWHALRKGHGQENAT